MSLMEAVKKTIEYGQKHRGKLDNEQLWMRLISNNIYSQKEVNGWLVKNKKNIGIISKQKENVWMREKMEKAKALAKLVKNEFEDILLLGVTGSVAAEYPQKSDDIDLLIITKRDKLWINRLKLRWWVWINKIPHRRFGKAEKADEFCFNLWLDEESMRLTDKRQNLNNAIDLILMKPLINKNNTYEKFIKLNDWAKKWVATGYSLKPSGPKIRTTSLDPASWRASMEALLDKVINWLVFWPQFWFMKGKIKKERVGLHEAFFHR